jgi:hypothetical protein
MAVSSEIRRIEYSIAGRQWKHPFRVERCHSLNIPSQSSTGKITSRSEQYLSKEMTTMISTEGEMLIQQS